MVIEFGDEVEFVFRPKNHYKVIFGPCKNYIAVRVPSKCVDDIKLVHLVVLRVGNKVCVFIEGEGGQIGGAVIGI